MLISSFFWKKISSVNSQLSKEINFEILFRSLEHVLFHLWSALIGQSASVLQTANEASTASSILAFKSLFPTLKSLLSTEKFWNFVSK